MSFSVLVIKAAILFAGPPRRRGKVCRHAFGFERFPTSCCVRAGSAFEPLMSRLLGKRPFRLQWLQHVNGLPLLSCLIGLAASANVSPLNAADWSLEPCCSGAIAQVVTYAVGASVEVLWSGTWYPASIKAIRGRDQWLIGYDGYGTSWDEVVGLDRIRARRAKAAASAQASGSQAAVGTKAAAELFPWPARPAGAITPIQGAYLTVQTWMFGTSLSTESTGWFFTNNGRFSRGPSGGVNLAALAVKAQATRNEGSYWVQDGQLLLAWADGREPWRSAYQGADATVAIGNRTATRRTGFAKGWRFNGSCTGGASIGGGALSSSSTMQFNSDGTYQRQASAYIASVGRTSEVSGGTTSAASGTYAFDGYTLTLQEGGKRRSFTVFAFGDFANPALPPEWIYREGTMMACKPS